MDQKATEFIKECTELEQEVIPVIEGKHGRVVASVFSALLVQIVRQSPDPNQAFEMVLESLKKNFDEEVGRPIMD